VEWLEALADHIVAIDTAPLIYFIEDNTTYAPLLRPFFEAVDNGKIRIVTSTITLLEVLIHPLRHQLPELAQNYRNILLHAEGLSTVPVTATVAERAAKLRAEHNLRTPDAIQLATAIEAGASHFLTNDVGFPKRIDLQLLLLSQPVSLGAKN
jgi:predicted nucleic acid-binding protein